MISYRNFCRAIDAYVQFDEYLDSLGEFGINIWETDAVAMIRSSPIELMNAAFNLPEDDAFSTPLDYYIYELECGRRMDLLDEGANDPVYGSRRKLYEYLCTFAKS